MSQYAHSRSVLSLSTDGRPILLATTTGSGDAVHTVSADAGVMEEVWIWASNTSSSSVTLALYLGGTSSPGDEQHHSLGAHETALVCPGMTLQNGLTVKAKPGTTNVVTISGYSNTLTPK